MPYTTGHAAKLHLEELDPYRVISAQYSGGFLVVLGERKGKYTRLVYSY